MKLDKILQDLGKAAYPVGYTIGNALKIPMFKPDEVEAFGVSTTDADGNEVPNFYSGSIYGTSVTHLVAGLALGALVIAPMIKGTKSVARRRYYRRASIAKSRAARSYVRRRYARRK